MKAKLVITLIFCLLLAFVASNIIAKAVPPKASNANNNKIITITQRYAMNKLIKIDKDIKKLIPCDKTNTEKNIINKYTKTYYMFLVNYGSGDEEYTSESLYLVNKKTGVIYTLEVNGIPRLLSRSH